MPSQLASVPVGTRRRAASVAGCFAALCTAIGVLSWTRDENLAVRVIGVVVLVAAAVLVLITWGLLNSIRIDRISAELDAELMAAIAEHDATCGCGVQHDPSEMHTVCSREGAEGADGANAECAHDCETCVLESLRH